MATMTASKGRPETVSPLRRDAPRVATTLDPLRDIPTEPACLTRGTSRIRGRSFGYVAGCGSTNSRLIPLWPHRG